MGYCSVGKRTVNVFDELDVRRRVSGIFDHVRRQEYVPLFVEYYYFPER
jgi:hypothetical protein